MMNYYTRIEMNEKFNKEILLEMVFGWLETTRNKMPGLLYEDKIPFSYEVDKKKICIDSFHNKNLITIQFVTSSNRKEAQFVVEIVYNIQQQWLDLMFTKELTENSKYIPGNNMPRIFKQLISSEYCVNDASEEPKFLKYNEYRNTVFTKPTVILGKNKRCLLSPFGLTKDMFGLVEVVCVYTKYEPFIKIVNGEGSMVNIPFVNINQTTQHISETVVSMLEELYKPSNYDFLLSHRLSEEQKDNEQLQEEIISETEQQINMVESSYDEFKNYYAELIEEYNQLIALKVDLEKQLRRNRKDYLLNGSRESYKQEEALLIDIFKSELRRLDNEDVYRRKDIVNALMEVMEDEN